MKRYYIIFMGRVQGVGFRYTLMTIAKKYHMTGYVRNLYNGNVEVEIQGEHLSEFLKEAFEPHYFIEIEDYSIKEIPLEYDEYTFNVRY